MPAKKKSEPVSTKKKSGEAPLPPFMKEKGKSKGGKKAPPFTKGKK
jgi:hypothetical protein